MKAREIASNLRAQRAALAGSAGASQPLIAHIRERRAALVEQLEQGQAQCQQLENVLADLRRNLDAMHGGKQELDALLTALGDD